MKSIIRKEKKHLRITAYRNVSTVGLATIRFETRTPGTLRTDGAESMAKTVRTTIQIKLGLQHADQHQHLGFAYVVSE